MYLELDEKSCTPSSGWGEMEHVLRLPGRSGNLKNAGWMRKTSVRFHSSHGWMFHALPDRSREAPAIGKRAKNPVFAPRSHGKMAPWHPMPPHAPCMDHGPGFRLNLSGTWRGALTPLAQPVISGSSPMGWLLWGRADINLLLPRFEPGTWTVNLIYLFILFTY